MAKKISRRKILMNLTEEINRLDEIIKNTDPTVTFQERRKTTDKNGNEKDVEVTVCPYEDFLKQKERLMQMYIDLTSNKLTKDAVLKCLVDIGMFGGGLVFETKNCFTFETVRNFIRRPKR